MTAAELISSLHDLGVQVVRPDVGRVKLVATAGDVPQAAIDLAKPLKEELLSYLCSQRCQCGAYMVPFGLDVQGWRNWDCLFCGAVRPVREA